MLQLNVSLILALCTSATPGQDDHVIRKRFSWREEHNLYWSEHCDWNGNDISSVNVRGEECGPTCARTLGCTHFTWNHDNGGTCWLKGGYTSLGLAQPKTEYMVCGLIKNPQTEPHARTTRTASSQGRTTRYWDCCKVSCGWNHKADVSAPVTSCQKNGVNPIDVNAASGCTGGPSYTCNSNQPWAVNDNLAYGFAAARLTGQSEADWCCACFQLEFTSGPVQGKKMVVQVTNTGGDLGDNHFDIQMPGGGVGLFNGCASQWNAPPDGWGKRYGGVGSRAECNQLPQVLRPGCFWRFDWFRGADNPTVSFSRVSCPAELIQKSNCRRTGE